MLEESGFSDVQVGPPVDTFGGAGGEDSGFTDVRISEPFDPFAGAGGEEKARSFDVYGYTFIARRP